MAKQFQPLPVQYITEENGRRVGVVLKWEDYMRLMTKSESDPDILADLTISEVEALAQSSLSPQRQDRLNELLTRQEDASLTEKEEEELDHLLEQVDQLNILRARAMLTLKRLQSVNDRRA